MPILDFVLFAVALHAGVDAVTRGVRVNSYGHVVHVFEVRGRVVAEVTVGKITFVTLFRGGASRTGSRRSRRLIYADYVIPDVEPLQTALQWTVGLRGGLTQTRILELMREVQPWEE